MYTELPLTQVCRILQANRFQIVWITIEESNSKWSSDLAMLTAKQGHHMAPEPWTDDTHGDPWTVLVRLGTP